MPVKSSEVSFSTNYPPSNEPVRPHKYQWQILDSDGRFLGFIAGKGSGKTWLGPIWLLEEIREHPEDRFMIVAPNYGMLRRRIIDMVKQYFDREGVQYNHVVNAWEIRLGSGGKIFLCSAEHPDSLEGVPYRAIWADEAGQMSKQVWQILRSRVRLKRGRVLLTTTPYLQSWLKKDVYMRHKEGDEDFFVVQCDSTANPEFDVEEYERERELLPPEEFNRKFKGQFVSYEGLIYKEMNENHIIESFKVPDDWRLYAGIDWGFNHPFVFELYAHNMADDVIYNVDEYYSKGGNTMSHASQIAQMVEDREVYAYFDRSRPELAADLKGELAEYGCLNIAFRKADNTKNSVYNGIMFVKKLLIQGKLKYFKTCEKNIEEKGLYQWEGRADGDLRDKPKKEDDDTQDAERCLLYTHFNKKKEPGIFVF